MSLYFLQNKKNYLKQHSWRNLEHLIYWFCYMASITATHYKCHGHVERRAWHWKPLSLPDTTAQCLALVRGGYGLNYISHFDWITTGYFYDRLISFASKVEHTARLGLNVVNMNGKLLTYGSRWSTPTSHFMPSPPYNVTVENHIDTEFIIQFALSLLIELEPWFQFSVIEPIIQAKKEMQCTFMGPFNSKHFLQDIMVNQILHW